MKDELKPAIAALQADLQEIEKRAAETKRAINRLCELAGASPMYANVDVESRPTITSMRTDQFYGKVMMTAAREYLEMRKAANLGPALPREIYEALVEGGFKFDTKNETYAVSGLRQTLRKNSSTFHRLPQGAYGLLAWYPNAKPAKDDDVDDDEPKVVRKPKARPTKPRGVVPTASPVEPAATSSSPPESKAAAPRVSIVPLVLDTMADGSDWTVARLKEAAAKWSVEGISGDVLGRKIQGTLLTLSRQGFVASTGDGAWHITDKEAAAA